MWLRRGLLRHRFGVVIGLIFGWTGVWIALWGAAIGAVIGIFLGAGVGAGSALGQNLYNLGAGQSVTAFTVLGGLVLGAVGGFLLVLRLVLFSSPFSAVIAMLSGVVVAMMIIFVMAAFERVGLRLRGYRRLSRDEARRIAPMLRAVAEGMDLEGLPRFAMADLAIPNAWTYMRTVVLTTGLLQTLTDGELRAVLAHELQHWRSGDSVGLHLIWACAWPIALVYNVGSLITGGSRGMSSDASPTSVSPRTLLTVFAWIIAWPAALIIRFAITPAVAMVQRRYEYEADAAAAHLGYSEDMITALRKMGAFEGGRTGWERAMQATHPPTELRIEKLQPSKPDDAQYQEDELHGPSAAEIARLARAFIPFTGSQS
jgi:Zn-dependent protease with chaperone function